MTGVGFYLYREKDTLHIINLSNWEFCLSLITVTYGAVTRWSGNSWLGFSLGINASIYKNHLVEDNFFFVNKINRVVVCMLMKISFIRKCYRKCHSI